MAYATVADDKLASAAEMEVIAGLRTKLEPELKALAAEGKDFPHTTGDIFFTRLLRGNNGDVEAAVKWYRDFIELRKKWGLDDIHMECEKNNIPWVTSKMPHYEEVSKYYTSFADEENLSLRTPTGQLVWYDAVGDARTKEMLAEVSNEKLIKFFHTLFERRTSTLDRLSREQGRIVKILKIMDFEGWAMWQVDRGWSKFEKTNITPVLIGTSIEVVQLIFLTNFPRFLKKAFDVISAAFPKRLLARFRLLDNEYMQNKEYLAEVTVGVNKQLIPLNKAHDDSRGGDESTNHEGMDKAILKGSAMERIVEVSAGQKVNWNFTMGRANECTSQGWLSKLSSKFSGTEVMFSVSAMWTDKMPTDIVNVPAKVRSAGADNGNAAEFWVDGKKIDYTALTGVNVVVVDLETLAVISTKAYDVAAKSESNDQLVSDLAAVPKRSMVLVGVKGTGAEELSQEAWAALESCGAVQKEGHWHKGYALVGTSFGQCISEARGADVVAEGDVPTVEMEVELFKPTEVSVDSGEQKGSVQVDRSGMVILRWSNINSMVADKALAKFKIAAE